jgi:hypothetical protein
MLLSVCLLHVIVPVTFHQFRFSKLPYSASYKFYSSLSHTRCINHLISETENKALNFLLIKSSREIWGWEAWLVPLTGEYWNAYTSRMVVNKVLLLDLTWPLISIIWSECCLLHVLVFI